MPDPSSLVGAVIAVMDYLIRNILVGGRSGLHTLLVFSSVLGGFHLFGLAGIVAEPLVVAVGIISIDIWRTTTVLRRDPSSEA